VEGRLAGVWPFFQCRLPLIGKALLPVGAHAADAFDPVARPEVMPILISALAGLCGKFSFAWLPLVSRDFTQRMLEPELKKNRHLIRKRALRFLIDLDRFTSFHDYFEMVFGPKTRQSLRRKSRRLFEEGDVRFLLLEKPAEIVSWLERVMNLERASWKGNAGVGIFHRPDHRAFYQLLLENLAGRGRLRLALLTIGDKLAAYEIGLLGTDYYCMHSMAFDPEFAAFSPGRLLMLHSLEKCINEKRRLYDFMQNDQEFKRQMATSDSHLWDCIILSRSSKGLAILAAVKAIHAWTDWRHGSAIKPGSLERNNHAQEPKAKK
jgi:CelD/BcsL family acetyltransferase involved in cellulose biosynthesis